MINKSQDCHIYVIAYKFERITITKLHYQKSYQFGYGHRNWGDTKGEDKHEDVCVMLNKKTASLHKKAKLQDLAPSTKNKLYVAITRAHGNVYFVYE